MLRATTLWALLGAAAVTVGQAQAQIERQLGGEQYCEQEIGWDRARCEASGGYAFVRRSPTRMGG